LKHLPAYQKDCTLKKVKPPVPKFEDVSKKIKSDNIEQSTTNRISPVNAVNETQGLGYTCGSNISNPISQLTTPDMAFKEALLHKEIVMATFGKVQFQDAPKNEDLPLISVKVEEKDNVKIEDLSDKSTSYSETSSIINSISTSTVDLDRKDMKKFQKFVELCEDYQKKLNISNPLVCEKFKQLATIVIPKLLSHFKSKPFEAVAAAVLLYACREVDHPVTLKQIVSIADSKEKLINKCVFTLKEILPSNAEVKHFKAGEFINVLADKLKLGEHVRAAANKIWENIEKLNFMKSIHAVTLAACCLKFACSLSDSDQEFETLSLAAGITKMTLKNMYRELFPYRFYFITADCMLKDPNELKKL
jgi:transcription initiation factor TFIIIB Brf1 subunit/transcription initiation factor TFIIB